MSPNVLKRVVAFETGRYVRDRMTWAAIAAFAVLLLVGAVDYWNSLPPRSAGSRLFGEAYLLTLCLAFHAWIAQDRATRFDGFLVSNFLQPRVVYFGKMLSALLFLACIAVAAFVVALVAALGDVAYAAHYTALFLAASIVLLPAVVLAELAMTTRYPVPVLLALMFALLAVLNRTGHLALVLHWLGFDGQLNASSMALRSVAALLLTASLYPLYRLRLGLR